ncbi:serine hydrolase domain-containing protein [Sphingosinicella sp. LHD-64]|uniref:serine hydrolase domain-containing protein n=1 Tax=Sphingosinicella sp. LHD-64 TaxID=3072139 RepID=UPI00280E0561|nr:serine hydrolase domain-containing protein [Sphingosinicella sp. LHD-64]MDQ8756020.1 serine hydrolase domain-containing protein [Sphingosinicella sp. LHD-64]
MATSAAHADTTVATPESASARAIAVQLESYLDRAIRDDDFSGAIMLGRGGRTVFARATGLASRDYETANRIDTRFNFASIGKLFTGTAILRLVEQGLVRLDASFGTYLPAYPDADIARQVTIEQLLTHSSGLGNYWEAIASRAPQAYVNLPDFVPLFQGTPLVSEPGAQFGYSNVGYVVLGLVIEAVTGISFHDHVQQTIFAPLGMRSSGYWPLDLVVPNRSTGFVRDEQAHGAWRSNLFVNQFRGHSAGGGYSTVGDLIAFARAWREDRLYSRAMREEAARGRFGYRRGQYGLGISIETVNGHRIVGHSGGHVGIAGELMILEDLGWDVAILTNGDVDGFWGLNAFVKDLLCGESASTRGYWHSLALVRAAANDGLDAARAFQARRAPGTEARPGVLEVEAVKARHRGRPEAADRIVALAAELEASAPA